MLKSLAALSSQRQSWGAPSGVFRPWQGRAKGSENGVTYTVRPMGPCTMWAMLWWPRPLPTDDFPTPVVYAFKNLKRLTG